MEFGKRKMKDRWRIMKMKEYSFVINFITRLPKGKKVIDMGCGDGKLMALLLKEGYDSWGVELGVKPYIQPLDAIKIPKERIKNEDMRKTSFPDKTFDVIYCLSTLINVGLGQYGKKEIDPKSSIGDREAIEEFIRILKDEGRIILTLAFGEPGIRDVSADYRVYDEKRLERILKDLEIIEEHYYYWDSKRKEWIETEDKSLLKKAFPLTEKVPKGNAFLILKKK